MADENQIPTAAQRDGPDIRRQVEYYFSDENLPTDLHLLQCCGGRENLPVSISRICGFNKMRKFKKKVVVEALRESSILQVSTDGKTVQRKVPLKGKCVLDPDFFEDDDIAYDPRTRQPAVYPVPLLPQTKTKRPDGMSKNMLKPTGFEKTYVEAPITPNEAAEEERMYDPDKPFVERIEIAIQRFKQKRRMHEHLALVFNKWMRFGGVESGPKMFGGLSKQDLKEMNAEEIARATAIHNVPWDREDTKHWVVDFVGVAKAFLSSWHPAHYGCESKVVQNCCQVLRSFYNYLLFHTVCPEYNNDVEIARTLCDTAEIELPKLEAIGPVLPGAFNIAASTLFGGTHAGTFIGDKDWLKELKEMGMKFDSLGVRDEEARIKFRTGVATVGSDEQLAILGSAALKVLNDETLGLEVVEVQPADEPTTKAYAQHSESWKRKLGRLDPLGKLVCKPWVIDTFEEWDLPKDRYPSGKISTANSDRRFVFWLEDNLLENCFVGMKMHARILTLEGSIHVLDNVQEIFASFYKWLANELWMERKPKPVRWLPKGMAESGAEEKVEINGQNEEREERYADDDSDSVE